MTCLGLQKNGTVIKVNVDRYGDGCSFEPFHTYKHDARFADGRISISRKKGVFAFTNKRKKKR